MAWTTARVAAHLDVNADTAERIIGLVRGTVAPETESTTADWIAQCYHHPSEVELKMHAIAAALGMFGTEAIWGDSLTQPVAEYCNAGDAYAATVLYDYVKGRFLLTTWGDWVERYGDRVGVR